MLKFRFVDLIALCCTVLVLSGLTVKAIQVGTEDARKAQCVQHMAKLAEGVMKYDQAMGYLPPLATINNHPGWNVQILPYIGYENVHAVLVKNRLYDKDYRGVLTKGAVPVNPYDIGDTNIAGSMSTFAGSFREWYRFTCATSGGLADAFTQNDGDGITWSDVHTALSTVTEYRCTTRQPEVTIKKVTGDQIYVNTLNPTRLNSDLYEQSCMRGVTGDYAAGFFRIPRETTGDAQSSPAFTFFSIYSTGTDGEFVSTTSYSNIEGRANRWMFGEKYIPQFAVKTDTPIANMWNGGVHRTYTASVDVFVLNASIRAVGAVKTPIAVKGDEVTAETDFLSGNGTIRFPSNFNTGEYLWGSSHPGTFNMVSGDGSVQSTNTNISAEVFNPKWQANNAHAAVL